MPCTMKNVIMCQVNYISTQRDGENLQIVPKSTPMDTKQANPVI